MNCADCGVELHFHVVDNCGGSFECPGECFDESMAEHTKERCIANLKRDLGTANVWIENLHTVIHGGAAKTHKECDRLFIKSPTGRASCASGEALRLRKRSDLFDEAIAEIRSTFAQNHHAQEWADWIESYIGAVPAHPVRIVSSLTGNFVRVEPGHPKIGGDYRLTPWHEEATLFTPEEATEFLRRRAGHAFAYGLERA